MKQNNTLPLVLILTGLVMWALSFGIANAQSGAWCDAQCEHLCPSDVDPDGYYKHPSGACLRCYQVCNKRGRPDRMYPPERTRPHNKRIDPPRYRDYDRSCGSCESCLRQHDGDMNYCWRQCRGCDMRMSAPYKPQQGRLLHVRGYRSCICVMPTRDFRKRPDEACVRVCRDRNDDRPRRFCGHCYRAPRSERDACLRRCRR